VRAFLHGSRRHVVLLGVWLVLLLYTHTWGVFLAAAMAIAWLVLWRAGRVGGRDGAWLGAAIAIAYAPWMPTLAYQAAHTGAPWAARPLAVELLAAPGALFGYAAAPLLALAVITAVRRRDERAVVAGAPRGGARDEGAVGAGTMRRGGARDERVIVLAAIAVAAAGGAWLVSQLAPAWSPRYLAVLFGPLLLALAAVVARGTRWTAVALAGVAAVWLAGGSPPAKSNVRALAAAVAPAVRHGDLVVSTQPEQVPVLYRYLPAGVVYVTPLGVVPDPRVTDWRDALPQLRAGHADRRLLPLLEHVAPGTRLLLVTPSGFRRSSPWSRAVRARTREWRAALRTDPRVRALGGPTRPPPPGLRSAARAELFEVVSRTGTADRRAWAPSRTARG
jgi:mannosyltransferase